MTEDQNNFDVFMTTLEGNCSFFAMYIGLLRIIDRKKRISYHTIKYQKEVIPIDNDTDENGNEWETVGAKKTKSMIKTRTEVNTGSQVKMTKGKKVIDNKKLKKQTSQKYPAKKVTQLNKRQPNKSDGNNQNVNKDRHNSSLSSSSPTECSSITSTSSSSSNSSRSSSSSSSNSSRSSSSSSSNSSRSSSSSSRDKTQSINTINGLSANNNNANLTRQIPVVRSNKKKVYHW